MARKPKLTLDEHRALGHRLKAFEREALELMYELNGVSTKLANSFRRRFVGTVAFYKVKNDLERELLKCIPSHELPLDWGAIYFGCEDVEKAAKALMQKEQAGQPASD